MQRTRRADGLFALSLAGFVFGYAFDRVAPVLLGVLLLGYVAYARFRFQALMDEAAFEARVQGPTSTVFQDEVVRLRHRLRIRPPGVRVAIDLPAGEDLDVETIDVEPGDVRPAGAVYEVTTHARPRRRGRFHLETLEITLGDPDGLFERRFDVRMPVEFTAHAPLAAVKEGAHFSELEALVLPERAEPGDWSLEVLTHRPYRLSDRDRDIDWKVSARYDELLSRIFEKEVERPVVVLLDATRVMRYQRFGRSMLDHASEFASALVRGAHDAGKAVGFAAYDEHQVLTFRRPSSGRSVPRQITERIATLPDPIELPPEGLVIPQATPADAEPRAEPTAFERKIAPFLGGTTRIPNGLARAVTAVGETPEPRTYLVFTPLLRRPDEATKILSRLTSRQQRVLVAAPFAPFYLTEGSGLEADELERVHEAWQAHQARLSRVRAIGGTVIDLLPSMAPRELARSTRGTIR